VIERGVIMTNSGVLSWHTADHLKLVKTASDRLPTMTEPVSISTLADAERAHIISALRETNWVISGPRGAAAQLGLPRTTLIARMQRLGIAGQSSRSRSQQSLRPSAPVMEAIA
jgi:transcriptional regulator with GAF, ATPase, and Fis domain